MNTDSVPTQYGDGAGEFANYKSLFGDALIDTNLYPSTAARRRRSASPTHSYAPR
jgi:hypothetical protein